VIFIVRDYVGFAVHSAEPGTISTLNIYDVRPASNWHGFFGVSVMVQEFNYQQQYRIDGTGIDIYNLLFPCLEYGIDHEIYASPSDNIDWDSVEPASPEFIDDYFNITSNYMSAQNTFTEQMSIVLGGVNLSGIPATHTYVNSTGQKEYFALGLLKDSLGNPIFVTPIEDFTEGFTGDILNYQLMVAVPSDRPITYYFYSDPYDQCPEGYGEMTLPGNVTGIVTDKATGARQANARVIIAGEMAYTDVNGSYNIELQSGSYYLVALKVGYQNYMTNVTVVPLDTVVVNIPLEKSQEHSKRSLCKGAEGGAAVISSKLTLSSAPQGFWIQLTQPSPQGGRRGPPGALRCIQKSYLMCL
jgi:hypothetical protein